MTQNSWYNCKQDGRLAPAYFSPNYNSFDQALQTVEIDTTVLNLVFKEFYKHQFHYRFLYFMPRGIKIFRRGTLLCCRKFLVSKNVRDKRGGGYNDFPSKMFLSHRTESFRRGTFLCFRKFQVSKILCVRGKYHDFP